MASQPPPAGGNTDRGNNNAGNDRSFGRGRDRGRGRGNGSSRVGPTHAQTSTLNRWDSISNAGRSDYGSRGPQQQATGGFPHTRPPPQPQPSTAPVQNSSSTTAGNKSKKRKFQEMEVPPQQAPEVPVTLGEFSGNFLRKLCRHCCGILDVKNGDTTANDNVNRCYSCKKLPTDEGGHTGAQVCPQAPPNFYMEEWYLPTPPAVTGICLHGPPEGGIAPTQRAVDYRHWLDCAQRDAENKRTATGASGGFSVTPPTHLSRPITAAPSACESGLHTLGYGSTIVPGPPSVMEIATRIAFALRAVTNTPTEVLRAELARREAEAQRIQQWD